VLKYFPVEPSSGLKLLKAMSTPYSGVKFVPTGGIDTNNLHEYLPFDRVLVSGATWIAETGLISAGRFDEITRIAHEAVELIRG
jgi:2-dehydro-3-deoxyphosphogluconate aldolase/(4S)-4-hydroxy-2-oxoglutarate aldolase